MERKPITPARHGLIDYGFGIVNLGVPTLLGLTGAARVLPAVWAVAQGTLNAFTDHRYAVGRVIPFATHGRAESFGLPALAAATVISGAPKQPRARLFLAVLFAALVTNYMLTDYKATPEP
jgi:hypothetical protein